MTAHLGTRLRAAAIAAVGLALVITAGLAAPASADKVTPDFFGMHDTDWSSPPRVPVGAANLTTSNTYWPRVQPSADVFEWAHLDAQVAAARSRGAQPMIVLGFTPTWAAADPGAETPRTSMPNLDAWRTYVEAVATRYGTRLDYQIWPEPNVMGNWTGTPADMAVLTGIASEEIRSHAGSGATVVSPAFALRLPDQRSWMKSYFDQRLGGRAVASHLDVVALDPFPEIKGTPEDSANLVKAARNILAKSGVRLPLWTNEINYGVQGGGAPTPVRYSANKQASFVMRTYALHAALGVDRVYWLGWFDTDTMAVDMADTSGRPLIPGQAYARIRSWLLGTNVQNVRVKRGVYVVTAKKGRNQTRRIYWKPTGRAKLKAPKKIKKAQNFKGRDVKRQMRKKLKVSSQPLLVVTKR